MQPCKIPDLLKMILTYFPYLDELLLLSVLAFPKASNTGFDARTFCSNPRILEVSSAANSEKKPKINFVVSVFPDPKYILHHTQLDISINLAHTYF